MFLSHSFVSAPNGSESPPANYCVALYDYDGDEAGDELIFEEGQIIRIISKCAHSIDDGWWKGELEGHIGNFPSLVVEECDEYGEPITNQWDETPPQSAPPVFTPPDVPNFLVAAEVIVTQPTPLGENSQQQASGEANSEEGFQMELTRNQQKHYGTQFQGPVPSKYYLSCLCFVDQYFICLLFTRSY